MLTGFVTRVMTGATSRIGTVNPFGAHEFSVGIACSILCIVFCRLLFVLFLYSHDIIEIVLTVALDTIKTILFLLAIALSVLFRFMDYDYPFCIFKLFFHCKPRLCGFLTVKKTKTQTQTDHHDIMFNMNNYENKNINIFI